MEVRENMRPKNSQRFRLTRKRDKLTVTPMRKQSKLTVREVIEALKARQGDRSLRQFAEELGVSAAYLSDIYLGKRQPGEKVLKQFGITKSTVTTSSYQYGAS
jgi:transcriptional regulator with XRE-family HTH domain